MALRPINYLDLGEVYSDAANIASDRNDFRRQSETRNYLAENPNVFTAPTAGDAASLGVIDPEFGFKVGGVVNKQQASAQQMAAEARRKLGDQQAEAAATQAVQEMMVLQQFVDAGDEAGYRQALQQVGIDEKYPQLQNMAAFNGVAVQLKGVSEAILSSRQLSAQPERKIRNDQNGVPRYEDSGEALYSDVQPESQEVFRPATQEEAARYGAAAGQINTKTGQFFKNDPPRGMSVDVRSDGSVSLREGAGVGGGKEPGAMNVKSAGAMIDAIDGILNDPAFDQSTGVGSLLQGIPGTPQRRVGARVDQLNGQAFLQAFESLKGAGQITETEGRKATQAIGRLDAGQSPDDYRESLTELRAILMRGFQRKQGWANFTPEGAATMSAGEIQDAMESGAEITPEVRDALRQRLFQLGAKQ